MGDIGQFHVVASETRPLPQGRNRHKAFLRVGAGFMPAFVQQSTLCPP
jgi:hypothetical protein